MKLELQRTICISCFTSIQNVAAGEPKPKAHNYSDPAYSAGYMLAQGKNEGVEEEVAAHCAELTFCFEGSHCRFEG